MGFFKYPYTDLNELNLDWVIAKIKYIEQAKNIIYDNSGTTLISNNVQDAIDEIYNLITGQGVTSFNSRVGAVVPEAGDYTAAQVTYDNTNTGYTATDVQAAIDEADAKIEAVSQTVPVTYVETFNGRSGAVTPDNGDYSATQVTYDNTVSGLTATDTQAAIDELAAAPGGVTSFNNRTGAVVPAASDYDAAQVDFDDTIAQTGSSNVQGALEYVATRGASAQYTTYDNTQSGLTATNVQAAIDEVANDVLSSGVASFNGRTGAVNPAAGDYDGSQVDYDNTVSGLTATNVQSAIDEIAGQSSGVSSFNGRTGAVVPTSGDYDLTELGDVAISTPAQDEVLKYDAISQKWINGTGGGSIPAGAEILMEQKTFTDSNAANTMAVRMKAVADAALAYVQSLPNDRFAEIYRFSAHTILLTTEARVRYDNTAVNMSARGIYLHSTPSQSRTNFSYGRIHTVAANNELTNTTLTTTPAISFTDYINTTDSADVYIVLNIYKKF